MITNPQDLIVSDAAINPSYYTAAFCCIVVKKNIAYIWFYNLKCRPGLHRKIEVYEVWGVLFGILYFNQKTDKSETTKIPVICDSLGAIHILEGKPMGKKAKKPHKKEFSEFLYNSTKELDLTKKYKFYHPSNENLEPYHQQLHRIVDKGSKLSVEIMKNSTKERKLQKWLETVRLEILDKYNLYLNPVIDV